jgi:hypothetical protein
VLYKSSNGGSSWSLVPGAPLGVLPQRGQIGPDGNLYITFSQPATYNGTTFYGPDGLQGGQVWKYNISAGIWTSITPVNDSNGASNYGFSGLSVDPVHPGVVAVMTIDRYDGHGEALFRTANGGASWVDTTMTATFSGRIGSTGNWAGVYLDPFNTNHAFTTYGGGVWETNNLGTAVSGGVANFASSVNGIEEVGIAAIASTTPTQYGSIPVLTGAWDVCGYAHISLTSSPTSYTNPTCSKVTGLDWAKNNPAFVVRVEESGWSQDNPKHYGAISYNGGYSWTPFGNQAGSTTGGGDVAVAADGSAILWSPEDIAPVVSNSQSYNWTSLGATLPKGTKIAADGYNASNFFAYDPATSRFFTSTNSGVSWTVSATGLTQWGNQIVAPFGRPCDIWLATWNGLYHNTGCGWGAWPAPSSAVTATTSVGFGKAAPGQYYPTIYMAGTVNGITGLFRSTDIGVTWVKISDSAHQYAGFGVVSGDPKTFGTVYVAGRGLVYGLSPN